MADIKKTINLSRKIPNPVKELILKYVTTSSRYNNGVVYGLKKPIGMGKISKNISGCSVGADKDGFFVYTHRCRSKSKMNPLKITKKTIDFIKSTG